MRFCLAFWFPDLGSTDGRSNGVGWKNHGEKIEDCEYIWMAVTGPDTPHQVIHETTVTQSQIAATVVACLSCDYQAAVPRAAHTTMTGSGNF